MRPRADHQAFWLRGAITNPEARRVAEIATIAYEVLLHL
jgi:hypothetical protein